MCEKIAIQDRIVVVSEIFFQFGQKNMKKRISAWVFLRTNKFISKIFSSTSSHNVFMMRWWDFPLLFLYLKYDDNLLTDDRLQMQKLT